jgi:putative endonuclease
MEVPQSNTKKQWVVYILECKDGSLYTGITDRLPQRLAAHRAGKGAKYTKGRAPLILRYLEDCEDHSQALKREIAIKRLTRTEKWELCKTAPKSLEEL